MYECRRKADAVNALPEWQLRVILEKSDLDGKLGQLERFVGYSEAYAALDLDARLLLIEQSGAMKRYSDILQRRIEHFA